MCALQWTADLYRVYSLPWPFVLWRKDPPDPSNTCWVQYRMRGYTDNTLPDTQICSLVSTSQSFNAPLSTEALHLVDLLQPCFYVGTHIPSEYCQSYGNFVPIGRAKVSAGHYFRHIFSSEAERCTPGLDIHKSNGNSL